MATTAKREEITRGDVFHMTDRLKMILKERGLLSEVNHVPPNHSDLELHAHCDVLFEYDLPFEVETHHPHDDPDVWDGLYVLYSVQN